jgi:outer membrane protein assembly factor BamB
MRLPTALIVLLFATAPAAADDGWTRFRGPNGSGVTASAAPTQWSEADYQWRTQLPGEGHSSPVLHRGRIYLTSTDPDTAEQWLVSVRAADGSIAWTVSLESRPYSKHRFNSFASATPAVDDRHIYVPVSSAEQYELVAVTHEGRETWRYRIGPHVSMHGSAASPIIYRDTVIMANDQDGESFIVAVEAATGRVRWKTPRSSGDAAYGTPSIFTGSDGVDQVILSSKAAGVTALDAATGKVLWEIADLFKDRTVFSPTVAGDLVVAGAGQGPGGKKFVAIRPGCADGSQSAAVVYEVDRALPYVPTPLYYKGLLFLLADGGIVTCVDAATGEVKWRERIGGDHFASPIAANGVLYCVSRHGQVTTLNAADTYEPIAQMNLGEPSHATPAVADGSIYLRTERYLMRVGN